MNAYLKELADICGIRKNLTYHLARHTFATTVTLTNGVSIESVSKMLGHTNIRTNANLREGNQPEKRQRDGSPFRQAACIHERIIERRTNMRTIERQLRARQTAVSLKRKGIEQTDESHV